MTTCLQGILGTTKRGFIAAIALLCASAATATLHFTAARPAPKWFTDGVMYQVQPRAFTADGSLKAAAEKLPYLKETGVTIVYLLPVFKMDGKMDRSFWSPRQVKSGFNIPKNQYCIADYFHVDEEYGTDQDLKRRGVIPTTPPSADRGGSRSSTSHRRPCASTCSRTSHT